MALDTETTPDGSLDAAQNAFLGLLSGSPEDKRPERTPPEPRAATETPPAATPDVPDDDSEASETVPSPDEGAEAAAAAPEIRTIKVKLPDGEKDLPEDEVARGYLRNADYTRKTQDLADRRREFEEKEVAAVRQEREQYATYLGQLKTAITATMPTEPDWQQLRQTVTPDVFAAAYAEWDLRSKQLAGIAAEEARLHTEKDKQTAKEMETRFAAEAVKLHEALPDLRDPTKGPALQKELVDYAAQRGFTNEEFAKNPDHRLVVLLHDAMLGAKAKTKAPVIQNRIENAIAPTTPSASRSTQPVKSKVADALAKLKQTGKQDDAAAAFAAMMG